MSATFDTEWLLVSKVPHHQNGCLLARFHIARTFGGTLQMQFGRLGSLRSWTEAGTFNSDDDDVVHVPAFGETKLASSAGPPTLCFRDNMLNL